MPTANCSICDSTHLAEKFSRGPWRYVACGECGHAFLTPLPEPETIAEQYDEAYFVASENGGYADYQQDERLHRANARDRLARLAYAGAPNRRLLDVGCATGFFLDEARQTGWKVSGVDCSAWARKVASERYGLATFASVAEARAESAEPFGAVTLFQVLEHLADPAAALAEIAGSLSERGVLMIETWDRESLVARLCGGKWQQITPPSVTHLFSGRSLRRLVEASGFVEVTIRRTGKRVSAGFVGNLLHKKHPRLLAPVGWVASRLWIRDLSVRYAMGDLITLTARKGPSSATVDQS